MDTSTLSFTDAAGARDQDQGVGAGAHHTSTLFRDRAQPPAQWFTRLISPLTSGKREVQSPQSTLKPEVSLREEAETSTQKVDIEEGDGTHWMEVVLGGRERMIPFLGESESGSGAQSGSSKMRDDPVDAFIAPPGWERPRVEPAHAVKGGMPTIVLIFIPVLVVVLTVLVGLVCFLVAVLFMRRRRGIRLTEDGGPLDLSKSDGVIGEGGTEGVEARWLETCEPDVREGYKRAKEWQDQYPPASLPTDITLTQFLSIQEKGVSAWSFEPDYEENLSLYVQSRTEITFLSDGPGMPAREGGGNSVMANLPLPKLNEVYYWEVKMYERPPTTEVAVGLATKPYPSFRLPGWNRFSVAYFASDGFKSHNYPFTAASHGPPLAEGDVLGIGYRPRTGTVFFTRNGRKLDDAYTGLQRLNLFPTIGANGPCTVHVNLGQAGFVFIEANVKKWGLAPMVGTLAPPPAYGSERGSILLDAGYGTPGSTAAGGAHGAHARRLSSNLGTSVGSTSSLGTADGPRTPRLPNPSRRHRTAGRSQHLPGPGAIPAVSSPLRGEHHHHHHHQQPAAGPGPTTAGSRRRALAQRSLVESSEPSRTYISPTDTPTTAEGPRIPSADVLEELVSEDEEGQSVYVESESGSSTMEPNPPTPNMLDISMHSLRHNGGEYFESRYGDEDEDDGEETMGGSGSGESDETARPQRRPTPAQGQRTAPGDSPPPPGYAPLDPNRYANGLPVDLPEEMVNQAIAAMTGTEVRPSSAQAVPSSHPRQSEESRSRTANGSASGRFGWIFGAGPGQG